MKQPPHRPFDLMALGFLIAESIEALAELRNSVGTQRDPATFARLRYTDVFVRTIFGITFLERTAAKAAPPQKKHAPQNQETSDTATTDDVERVAYWKGAFERMAARNVAMAAALKPFADLGVGSGPDHQADSYKIEYGAIRAARSALQGP